MFVITGCSNIKNSSVVKEEMLKGTWQCVTSDTNGNYDLEVNYYNSGLFYKSMTTSNTLQDVKGEFQYAISLTGSWQLKGNTVFEIIEQYEVEPLNDLSIAFEDVIKKKIHKNKQSHGTVVTINKNTINWISNGIPMSCDRSVK